MAANSDLTDYHPHILLVHKAIAGTEFGIDYSNWYIGPRFCGIHSIPDGFHFVYTSNVDKEQQHSPRNGVFLFFESKEITSVFRTSWDEVNNELHCPFEKIKRESISGISGVQLGQYPLDDRNRRWKTLTSFVTGRTVKRLIPKCGRISHMTQVDCTSELEKKEKSKLDIKDSDSNDDDLKIRFTPVPKKKFPDGATSAEITKYSLDQSYTLNTMLSSFGIGNAEEELLAEIQFAFVCFMIGQVYDAFEHWKTVVRLLCSCDEAMYKKPAFFLKFLDILKVQLEEIPQDFFVDIVAQQNFLVQNLKVLFSNIGASDQLDSRLIAKGKTLERFLVELFDWSFDDEDDDEDRPVIVEGSQDT